MNSVSLDNLVNHFQFKVLYRSSDWNDRQIYLAGINRAGLELTGFWYTKENHRLFALGAKEYDYILTVPKAQRRQHFLNIMRPGVPAIVITKHFKNYQELLVVAREKDFPIIYFPGGINELASTVHPWTTRYCSNPERIHASFMQIFGAGVLITGESGVGKSENCISLIRRGHFFVADDAVDLFLINGKLSGSGPMMTKNLIEVRGVGIVDVKTTFGAQYCVDILAIDCVVNLVILPKVATRLDLADNMTFIEYLDKKIPKFTLPVSPGRDVAELIETIIILFRNKYYEQDAVLDLSARWNKNFAETKTNISKDTKQGK